MTYPCIRTSDTLGTFRWATFGPVTLITLAPNGPNGPFDRYDTHTSGTHHMRHSYQPVILITGDARTCDTRQMSHKPPSQLKNKFSLWLVVLNFISFLTSEKKQQAVMGACHFRDNFVWNWRLLPFQPVRKDFTTNSGVFNWLGGLTLSPQHQLLYPMYYNYLWQTRIVTSLFISYCVLSWSFPTSLLQYNLFTARFYHNSFTNSYYMVIQPWMFFCIYFCR